MLLDEVCFIVIYLLHMSQYFCYIHIMLPLKTLFFAQFAAAAAAGLISLIYSVCAFYVFQYACVCVH